VSAIEAAARRHPGLGWVVANADRSLPYADASFRAVLSVTARVNAVEVRRVLIFRPTSTGAPAPTS